MTPLRLFAPLLAFALAACEGEPAAAPVASPAGAAAAPVVVARVDRREFAQPIEAIGTARSMESVTVTSRVSGRVRRIFFEQGSWVEEGDPLVQLEDDEERAALRTAEAGLELAQTRHRRLLELSRRGLVSRDELDAQAETLEAARAERDLARVLLEQRTIRAPFSGVLGFREVSPGTLVQPGTAIVTLDAIDRLRVEFQVPETLLSGLSVGSEVLVQSAAWRGETFRGAIETIGARVDEVTRAVTVHALIDNAGHKLKPGMLLTVTTQAQARTALFVPEAALVPENAEQYVWRVAEDGTVQRLRIDMGARMPGYVEVQSGLSLGDTVVVEGQTNLRPGRQVRVVERPGVDRRADV